MANLLSLEEFREELKYHPWHFWQLSGSKAPITSSCNSVVMEYAWQNANAAGRDDIRSAIESVENRIFTYLNFMPKPRYRSINLPFPKYPDVRVDKLGYSGSDGRWIPIQLPDKYIQSVGVETRTLLETVDVVYSDLDGDGLDEIFTLTLTPATTITDLSQIAVYYQSTDRMGNEVGERWRVTPVKVSQDSGTGELTISGKAWMLVKPVLYEGSTARLIDPEEPTNFVSKLDVYRRYTNTEGTGYADAQATLIWETRPGYHCNCIVSSGDPAAVAYATARVGLRNGKLGIVGVGESVYDAVNDVWVPQDCCGDLFREYSPDRIIIRYLAGYPQDSANENRMSSKYRQMLAHLAMAELPERICACDVANRTLHYWQFDLAGSSTGEQYTLISREDLANPLGTKRGQVMAYKQIKDERILTGFAI